jgi:uncharacterized membrane protein (DUF373 family)
VKEYGAGAAGSEDPNKGSAIMERPATWRNPFAGQPPNAWFEIGVLGALQLLLMIMIVLGAVALWLLLWIGLAANRLASVADVTDVQRELQNGFAGVLLVLLGLEILQTLRNYFVEHRVRLEVILVVAIIALGRHIIQLDFAHVDGISLLGIAALALALSGSYYLARRG